MHKDELINLPRVKTFSVIPLLIELQPAERPTHNTRTTRGIPDALFTIHTPNGRELQSNPPGVWRKGKLRRRFRRGGKPHAVAGFSRWRPMGVTAGTQRRGQQKTNARRRGWRASLRPRVSARVTLFAEVGVTSSSLWPWSCWLSSAWRPP